MFRKISFLCLVLAPVMVASNALVANHETPQSKPTRTVSSPSRTRRPSADTERHTQPPLASAAASDEAFDAQPTYGFCPEQAEAGYGVPRPELSTLLALRAAEMMDRVRHTYRSGEGSPQLRQALAALFSGEESDAVESLAQAPDRMHGSFDYATSAAIVLSTQALGKGILEEAKHYASAAVSIAPDDPLVHVLDALVAEHSHAQEAARRALRRAYELAPDEPAIALALGQALSNTPDLDGAIAALTAYLEDAPMDIPIGQLRERLRTQRQLHEGLQPLSVGGVTLLWPAPELDLQMARTLLDELIGTLGEAAALLEQRPRQDLLVVVYRDRADMLASTCVPPWTEGVFDGVLRVYVDSIVYPQRRQAVLRHEVFHAQLRSIPVDAPHWFHEGAAQFFAQEESSGHARSYRLMLEHQTYVPFASLEGSFLVISAGRDARLAYHQSLAMVQMIVDAHGPRALADAVRYLRAGGNRRGLWLHMLKEHGDGASLLAHVRKRLEQIEVGERQLD